MTTWQPLLANKRAVAAPTPLLDQVIIATLLVKSFTLEKFLDSDWS